MRVNKKEMAKRIRYELDWLGNERCDVEETVDTIFYHFARLHGIGVIAEPRDNGVRYEFVAYPEDVTKYEYHPSTVCRRKVECDGACVIIDCCDEITEKRVRSILKFVEGKLSLPHWEDYLEEKPKDESPVTSSVWTDDSKAAVDAISDRIRYEVKQQMRLLTNSVYGIPKKPDEMYYLTNRGFGKSNWATEAAIAYCKNDVIATRNLYNAFNTNNIKITFDIEQVIFNDPATIVIFKDGTKTVVKAQDGEPYDPEKGLAMALCKKTMGNTRDYYLVFKKYLKQWEKAHPEKEDEYIGAHPALSLLADKLNIELRIIDTFAMHGIVYTQYEFSNGVDSHIVAYPEVIAPEELRELKKRLRYLRK